jgi:hypothetical protein
MCETLSLIPVPEKKEKGEEEERKERSYTKPFFISTIQLLSK